MGPLFAGIFLLMIAGVATIVSFGVAKIFLPLKSAAIAALLFVGVGGFGTLIGLFGQALWLPPNLETPNAVLMYLSVSAVCGFALGAIAVWIFLMRLRSS
ncbi:hypothetical protein [Brevundimonas sp.]|uniref:hypothetical protein n=1 Tax=Brevundimonas sp. TaxID=1871086 RepID=UPI002D33618B|nr:hypothetical protein [Brevundimonas sp.]HYC74662.1 hypothetical protein [Brevundimonas sp.]